MNKIRNTIFFNGCQMKGDWGVGGEINWFNDSCPICSFLSFFLSFYFILFSYPAVHTPSEWSQDVCTFYNVRFSPKCRHLVSSKKNLLSGSFVAVPTTNANITIVISIQQTHFWYLLPYKPIQTYKSTHVPSLSLALSLSLSVCLYHTHTYTHTAVNVGV